MTNEQPPQQRQPLQQYPQIFFPGKIHFISSNQDLQAVSGLIHKAKVLGFDTETKPSFKKGEVYKIALLQLATETDAFIIQMQRIHNYEIIKNIFENENVIKVGAAIRDDIKQLQKTFGFVPKNFIEIQTLAKSAGLQNFGLKGMAEEILNSTITKGPKMTNWQAVELTDRQIMYAATDAWIGLILYQKLLILNHAIDMNKSEKI